MIVHQGKMILTPNIFRNGHIDSSNLDNYDNVVHMALPFPLLRN